MTKVIIGFGLAALLAITAVVLHAQQSVAGEWTMSVHGMSLPLALTQNGEKISGTLETPHGTVRLTGEFSKGKLSISGVATEEPPVQLIGTATLAADGSLAGNVSVNQMEMPFTAARAPGK
jgi:hypothetical protein